jgi:hypothetical protein
VLHEHILAIEAHQRSKLDLIIYSRGGDSDVPWSIVSMFREYSKEGAFSVLIPYRAHSSATLVALGADEIVMTKKAELGPIDITMNQGPYNPRDQETMQRLPVSVEDVTGYFALLKKIDCERPEEKMLGFQQLAAAVHPLVLGQVSRLLEQTELVALRLLNTRAQPFSEDKNRQIVKRLSSEIFSHLHTISRTEAHQYLGLEQVVNAEEAGIDDELWSLYRHYRDLFELEIPFYPDQYLIANDLDQHTWKELHLTCVESAARSDTLKTDIRVHLRRFFPPHISLNLGNITLGDIHLPPLPPDLEPSVIQQAIVEHMQQVLPEVTQAAVQNALQQATQALLSSMPINGFETVWLNTAWETINGTQ